MFSMESFSDWLLRELKKRDMSQSDLARAAKLGRGTISNIMTGTRNVGKDTLVKVAYALHLPPESVFRAAGILPASNNDPRVEEISHKFSTLDESRKNIVSKLLDVLLDEQEKEREQGSNL